MSPLRGAARHAHERRVLMDQARRRIADRDRHSVRDTEALLRSVLLVRPGRSS